jgi:glycosyltransferase involved in cell wall biosynthesis
MELADAVGVEQERMVMGRGGGDAARARVEREFSRAAQAERYLQVFEAVLAGRRGRPKPIEEKPLRAEE